MRHAERSTPRQARPGFTALLAVLGLLVAAGAAPAIPTNPDPCHTANCTPWANVAIAVLNPGADQHQHRNNQNLFGVNGQYLTYSVWDDRTYQYNAVADRAYNKAMDQRDFGHGFINVAPRYVFDNNVAAGTDVPAWARPLVTQVIDQWAAAVNELGNNVNGIPTETKIQFQQVPQGGEITIRFSRTFPTGPAGAMQPFPTEDQIYPDGGVAMPFLPGGGAPQGGRSAVLAFWTPSLRVLTFNRNLTWYQDTGNPANDLNPNFMPAQWDFYTTALHEWGHVLGLDHPVAPGAGTTMQPTQGQRNIPNSGIIRTIDAGSLNGAKNLYTIVRCPPAMAPAPAPAPNCPAPTCPSCPSYGTTP